MTTRMRFARLETERLIMRRWQESDRAPFAELNADPETMRFFPNTLDRAASDAVVEVIETRFDRQGFGFWALEVAATGTFIGFTGLNPLPDGLPGAGGLEVGWRLARHAWHHGYATEAARAALGVAFDTMGLPEIWSMTAVLNEPSRAVMRRLGLTETSRFDHPRIPPGDPLRPQVAYHGTRRSTLSPLTFTFHRPSAPRAILGAFPDLSDRSACCRRDNGMDSDIRTRAAIEEHWRASESGDIEAEHAIYAADAILDYPQSGERFRGRATISAQRGGHPASRHFTVLRIVGSGNLWMSECGITYDGVPTYSVSIMEFAHEHVAHESQYFADPFGAPAWRAALAEPMPGRTIARQ